MFQSELLNYKIIGKKEKNKAVQNLNIMLNKTKNNEQIASIHYELWKLTGNEDNRNTSAELYNKLYEKTPKSEFNKRILELNTKN